MGGRRIAVLVVVVALFVGLVPVDPGALAQDAGSNLAQEVTAPDPAEGGTLAVESVASFDPNGGEAIFEPGTAGEETFTYEGLDSSANYLVGVSRPAPGTHPIGSFVAVEQQASEPSPTPSPQPASSPDPTPTPSTSTSDGSGADGSSDYPSIEAGRLSPGSSTEEDSSSTAGVVEPICLRNPNICVDVDDVCEIFLDCGDPVQAVKDALEQLCLTDCTVPDVMATIYEVMYEQCGGGGGVLDCEQRVADMAYELVDQAMWIVENAQYEVCNGATLQTCATRVVTDTVAAIYDVACEGATTSRWCDDPVGELLITLDDYRYELCGYDSWQACATRVVAQTVAAIYDVACEGGTTSRWCDDPLGQPIALLDDYRYELCGYDSWDGCALRVVTRTVAAIYQVACEGAATSRWCTDPVGELLITADGYRYQLCGYDSWEACGTRVVTQTVAALYAIACEGATTSRWCADPVGELMLTLDDYRQELCGYDSWEACGTRVVAQTVAALYAIACEGATTSRWCADPVNELLITLDGYRYELCGYDSWEACAGRVAAQTIAAVVALGCDGGTTSSWCDDPVGSLENVVDSVCRDGSTTTTGVDGCVALVFQEICPNTSPGVFDMCYEEARQRILESLPPTTCVTLDLLCDTLPELECDDVTVTDCVPPPGGGVPIQVPIPIGPTPVLPWPDTEALVPGGPLVDSMGIVEGECYESPTEDGPFTPCAKSVDASVVPPGVDADNTESDATVFDSDSSCSGGRQLSSGESILDRAEEGDFDDDPINPDPGTADRYRPFQDFRSDGYERFVNSGGLQSQTIRQGADRNTQGADHEGGDLSIYRISGNGANEFKADPRQSYLAEVTARITEDGGENQEGDFRARLKIEPWDICANGNGVPPRGPLGEFFSDIFRPSSLRGASIFATLPDHTDVVRVTFRARQQFGRGGNGPWGTTNLARLLFRRCDRVDQNGVRRNICDQA